MPGIRYAKPFAGAVLAVLLTVGLTACGKGQPAPSPATGAAAPVAGTPIAPTPPPPSSTLAAPAPTSAPTTTSATPAPPPTAVPSPTAPPTTAVTADPVFTVSESTVTAAQLGGSWHTGCPVGPSALRQLTLTYWGFDGRAHTGELVVNASVTTAVTAVFRQLYLEHFPIRSMRPTADFGGSDPESMAADNTSGFNCRLAVTTGPPQWSVHAYGEAIDVNTVENPYIEAGTVMPAAGRAFTDRSDLRPGMAFRGGELVAAFAAVGWPWGGRWSAPDYQHFSATGG